MLTNISGEGITKKGSKLTNKWGQAWNQLYPMTLKFFFLFFFNKENEEEFLQFRNNEVTSDNKYETK